MEIKSIKVALYGHFAPIFELSSNRHYTDMKQTRQIKRKTQLDKANEVLLNLAVNVTSDDRKAAIIELGINRQTVGQYLHGEAKDLDIATKLIRLFRNNISERDKELTLSTK